MYDKLFDKLYYKIWVVVFGCFGIYFSATGDWITGVWYIGLLGITWTGARLESTYGAHLKMKDEHIEQYRQYEKHLVERLIQAEKVIRELQAT